MIGQGEVGLGLGAVGPEQAGALGIGAASDGQGQPEDAVESADRAKVLVVGIAPVLAFGAVEEKRGGVRERAGRGVVVVVVNVVVCAWGDSSECSYIHYTQLDSGEKILGYTLQEARKHDE